MSHFVHLGVATSDLVHCLGEDPGLTSTQHNGSIAAGKKLGVLDPLRAEMPCISSSSHGGLSIIVPSGP